VFLQHPSLKICNLALNSLPMSIAEQIVVDKKGKAVAVQIPVRQYKKLLAMMEEMEDIRAYRKAKKRKSKWIPAEKVFAALEKKHKK
jgi:hypothetical protein